MRLAATFVFLQTLVALSFSAPVNTTEEVHYHYLERRAQTIACGKGANGVPMRLGETGDAIVKLHGGSAPFLDYTDGDLAGVVKTVSSQPADSKGEHLVEVQVLKQALESKGGACEELIAETDQTKRQQIRTNIGEVLAILNGKTNLFFAETALETTKGDVASKALQGGKKGVTGKDANFVNRMQAVDNYLNTQFKAQSVGVAQAMDTKLKALFPGTSVSCATVWQSVLTFAKSEAARVKNEACGSTSNGKRAVTGKKTGSAAASCPLPAKKTAATNKTTTATKKPTTKAPATAKKPATKAPATTAKKPATVAKKPATTAKKPATVAKKPATTAKKPVTVAKKPATVAKKPATTAKKPATVAKKPATTKKTTTKKVAAKPKVAPKKVTPKKVAAKPKVVKPKVTKKTKGRK